MRGKMYFYFGLACFGPAVLLIVLIGIWCSDGNVSCVWGYVMMAAFFVMLLGLALLVYLLNARHYYIGGPSILPWPPNGGTRIIPFSKREKKISPCFLKAFFKLTI